MMTCPFDEYLSLPGISFSGIKSEGEFMSPTKKMVLGTKVHNYLLEPEKYDHEDIEIIKPLAMAIKNRIGPLFRYLTPEMAVLADFVHEGMRMKFKGRGDLVYPGKILIDVKVSEMPLAKAMQFFNYPSQTSGYALGFGCPVALIAQVNPKTKQTTLYNVPIITEWWEKQILRYGEPC